MVASYTNLHRNHWHYPCSLLNTIIPDKYVGNDSCHCSIIMNIWKFSSGSKYNIHQLTFIHLFAYGKPQVFMMLIFSSLATLEVVTITSSVTSYDEIMPILFPLNNMMNYILNIYMLFPYALCSKALLRSHRTVILTNNKRPSLLLYDNRPSYSLNIDFFFKIWLWKSKVKVRSLWCCTTTCLDNSTELITV